MRKKIKELNDIPKFWTYYDMKLRNYRASTQFDVEVLVKQRNLSFEDSFPPVGPSRTQLDWVEQSHFFGTETSGTSADQTHEIHLNPYSCTIPGPAAQIISPLGNSTQGLAQVIGELNFFYKYMTYMWYVRIWYILLHFVYNIVCVYIYIYLITYEYILSTYLPAFGETVDLP